MLKAPTGVFSITFDLYKATSYHTIMFLRSLKTGFSVHWHELRNNSVATVYHRGFIHGSELVCLVIQNIYGFECIISILTLQIKQKTESSDWQNANYSNLYWGHIYAVTSTRVYIATGHSGHLGRWSACLSGVFVDDVNRIAMFYHLFIHDKNYSLSICARAAAMLE